MSELERKRAINLARCRFAPATFAKRFARTIAAQAHAAEPKITERQAAQLAVQVYRFRRQIGLNSSLIPSEPPPGYTTPAMQRDAHRMQAAQAEYERRIAEAQPPIRARREVVGLLQDAPCLALCGLTG